MTWIGKENEDHEYTIVTKDQIETNSGESQSQNAQREEATAEELLATIIGLMEDKIEFVRKYGKQLASELHFSFDSDVELRVIGEEVIEDLGSENDEEEE